MANQVANNHDPIWSNLLQQIWMEQDKIKATKARFDGITEQWLRDITAQRAAFMDSMMASYRRLVELEKQIRAGVPADKLPPERAK